MPETNRVVQIGTRFIRWGLGLLVFGIFIGFGIIGHYLIGANHDTGEMFMKNVTLWFACPWTLSVYAVQAGSLGMIVIGIMYLVLGRSFPSTEQTGPASLWLCVAGLIAVFLTGYVGYFVVDRIWPAYYYTPVAAGKNTWLIAQALSIALYWLGLLRVSQNVWKITR
ncbi:MAG TPA: hypothetical protein VEI01_25620 [Terriglobales bacterium]|nr:hypothetical protein [Terriglobales bacterium]HXY52851.1 hypothetical protein [Terriglobales bacterium]